ncbi:MAG: type II toxin-antitoxin system VapC family toxin [Trichodesmium sp. MO_231.B1]|nr:type II toxin-antitoxin system VapC family toxin [Trichodesmium sp. MO_231.B1]
MTIFFKYVVDASVGIKQFIPNPLLGKTKQLFANLSYSTIEIYVPDLFYVESANTLWKYIRAGQLTSKQVQEYLSVLKMYPLQVVSTVELMETAVNIAVYQNISVYDATYVALSENVEAPLLTLDKKLLNSLRNTSYNICLFDDFSLPDLS